MLSTHEPFFDGAPDTEERRSVAWKLPVGAACLRVIFLVLTFGAVTWGVGVWYVVRNMSTPTFEHGPFAVHGVRYGMSRKEAQRSCRVGASCVDLAASPLAKPDGCTMFVDRGNVVVAVRGQCLEVGTRVVLRAGDTLGKVRQVLGRPDDERHEEGMKLHGRWIYRTMRIEVDYKGDVIERIHLGDKVSAR